MGWGKSYPPSSEFLLFVLRCERGGCLSFRHYIDSVVTLFPCAFKGIFTLVRGQTVVRGFFCLIVYEQSGKKSGNGRHVQGDGVNEKRAACVQCH